MNIMLKGIDVSTHNYKINWAKVKNAGIDFAIIKATQGRSITSDYYLFTDSQFKNNINGAYAADVACGVYHYLTAKTVAESIKEADYFLSVIAPYKAKITLFAAVDVEEDKYLPKDKALLTSIVNTFCERIKAAGYKPIVYTNPNYLNYRLNKISQWDLWLALWRDKSKIPTGYPNMKIWQYGAEAKVDGINGNVDANYGLFGLAQPSYADIVCSKCGFEQQTRDYINEYPYAADLWRKIAINLK